MFAFRNKPQTSTEDYQEAQRSGQAKTSATQVPLRRVTKNDNAILNTSRWAQKNKSELKLEDKVSLADERAGFLQGLVVYVGKVHFAKGTWVGIQLTGPSIGRGNCDGAVEGRKYFAHVGKNNGIFAPLSKVNKRLGMRTGDPKVDLAQEMRKTEEARMADMEFIDCLVQERAIAMLKLDEERRKKKFNLFDAEETHITRLKQMRLAEVMRARTGAEIGESAPKIGAQAPNLKYSNPNAPLQECDLKFAEGLELTQQNYCLSDPTLPDNPIVYASQPFLNMTGYDLNEILGRNCRFLQGDDTDKYAVYRVRLSIQEGADCHVCLANYRKDGTKFYNRLFMTALRCTKGRIKNYLGVQCEVSERVARRINQTERAKLEGNAKMARMDSTMDHLSVTSSNHRSVSARSITYREDSNVSESFDYAEPEPVLQVALDDIPDSVDAPMTPRKDRKSKEKRRSGNKEITFSPEPSKEYRDERRERKKDRKSSSSKRSPRSHSKSRRRSSSKNRHSSSSGSGMRRVSSEGGFATVKSPSRPPRDNVNEKFWNEDFGSDDPNRRPSLIGTSSGSSGGGDSSNRYPNYDDFMPDPDWQ